MAEPVFPRAAHRAGALLSIALVLGGVALRVAYVNRPFDHRTLNSWREADYAQVARNFWREDPNIFRPRIDWRRDGPGLVEMEFPLIPWVAGMLYRVVGYHEPIMRGLAAVLEIGSLLLFAGLARRLLPEAGAIAAVAFFAVNPLLVYLSTAMQPEPLMLFFAVLAVVLLDRWDRTGHAPSLPLAGVALGGAILAKAPAACLGFLFAVVVLRRLGLRATRSAPVWFAAVLALFPPAAWYAWARHYWVQFGNSLGMSNESPFIGLDMLGQPTWILGLLKWQTLSVLVPLGWILLAAAHRAPRAATGVPFVWLTSVWFMLLVSARTTAEDWAFYYHALAVAPACLLMGSGVLTLRDGGTARVLWLPPGLRRRVLGTALAVGTAVLLCAATVVVVRRRDGHEELRVMRGCGLQFASSIPPDARLVVRGGTAVHLRYGTPVAHDRSLMFAWLDRKGFTYADQELGAAHLERLAARGGRYWIIEPDELNDRMRAEIGSRFRFVDQCAPGYLLVDLQRGSARPAAPDAVGGRGR